MPLAMAAIVPHGFPIIPDLSEDAEGGLATREAMLEFGRRLRATGIEALIIAGPHGVRVEGAIALADVARGAGILHWEGKSVEINVPVDLELTDGIADHLAASGVAVARVGYAGNQRYQSCLPLDWGNVTPLWFAGHDRNLVGLGNVLAKPPAEDIGPPAVIMTPSRALSRETLLVAGRAIAAACAADPRPIAFIASCDWGHKHIADGPYGYDPASAEVDAEVVAAVQGGNLHDLLAISDERASQAAIDGLWQSIVLAGALEGTGFVADLLVYEAPRYYGMIVATFQPPAA